MAKSFVPYISLKKVGPIFFTVIMYSNGELEEDSFTDFTQAINYCTKWARRLRVAHTTSLPYDIWDTPL